MEKRKKKLANAAIKCAHFARYLSYHRAFNKYKGTLKLNFWIATYNNALDLAVLSWFHLFGYHNDDLHWKKVIDDKRKFKDELYNYLNIREDEFNAYWEKIKEYRDKDIAHFEIRPMRDIPEMSIALKAVNYYYKVLLKELSSYGDYSNLPDDLIEYHQRSLEQAINIVSAAYEATKNIKETVY